MVHLLNSQGLVILNPPAALPPANLLLQGLDAVQPQLRQFLLSLGYQRRHSPAGAAGSGERGGGGRALHCWAVLQQQPLLQRLQCTEQPGGQEPGSEVAR